MHTQLVWFKKDLRVRDHRPLTEAAERGPVICLYVYEPHLYEDPEFLSARLTFLNACLRELDERLRDRGEATWKRARDRIWNVKNSEEAQREADQIYEKHGSRRGGRS